MAKANSKTKTRSKIQPNAKKQPSAVRKFARKLKIKCKSAYGKVQTLRSKHIHLHRSFRRSYREDYVRQTSTPGLLSHAMITFKTIFGHWKVFLPMIAVMVLLYIVAVGLMSEEFYQKFQTSIDLTSDQLGTGELGNFAKAGLLLLSTITTGGLQSGSGEAQTIFTILLFLIIWLVTIYLLRHFMLGEHPKLRDGFYNALGPLLSTLIVFIVIFVQAIPIMLVIITYSAAVSTGFLTQPFYALVYFIFVALMLLLSGYLLSSSLMALIAVTSPGMYPFTALFLASDLMASRRMRLILRAIYLIFVVVLIFIITMLPIIMLDLWFKSMWEWIASWPIVPFFLLIVTCFVFIYATTYLYLYYRWLLDYKEK